MRISYPSESAPPIPGISIELPDGWAPVPMAGTVLAARKDTGPDSYAPNVIVTWTRQEPGFALKAATALLDEELASLPEAELLDAADVAVDGLQGRTRGVVFVAPGIGTLAQFHVYFVVDREVCSDAFHLTATIGGDQVDSTLPELRSLFDSVEVSATG